MCAMYLQYILILNLLIFQTNSISTRPFSSDSNSDQNQDQNFESDFYNHFHTNKRVIKRSAEQGCDQYILKDDVDFAKYISDKTDANFYDNIVRCNVELFNEILKLADSLDQIETIVLFKKLFTFWKNIENADINNFVTLVKKMNKYGECIELRTTILDYIVDRLIATIERDAVGEYSYRCNNSVVNTIYNFDNERGSKLISKVVAKLYDEDHLKSLITFVSKHGNKSQVLKGLEAILDQMRIRDDLANVNLFYLATMIRIVTQDKDHTGNINHHRDDTNLQTDDINHHTDDTSDETDDINDDTDDMNHHRDDIYHHRDAIQTQQGRDDSYLKNKLPESIRIAAFADKVRLVNKGATNKHPHTMFLNYIPKLTVSINSRSPWRFEVVKHGAYVKLRNMDSGLYLSSVREDWWIFGEAAFELGFGTDLNIGQEFSLVAEGDYFYIKSAAQDLYMRYSQRGEGMYLFGMKDDYALWSANDFDKPEDRWGHVIYH